MGYERAPTLYEMTAYLLTWLLEALPTHNHRRPPESPRRYGLEQHFDSRKEAAIGRFSSRWWERRSADEPRASSGGIFAIWSRGARFTSAIKFMHSSVFQVDASKSSAFFALGDLLLHFYPLCSGSPGPFAPAQSCLKLREACSSARDSIPASSLTPTPTHAFSASNSSLGSEMSEPRSS